MKNGNIPGQEFGSPNQIAAFVINAFHMTTEHAVLVFHPAYLRLACTMEAKIDNKEGDSYPRSGQGSIS